MEVASKKPSYTIYNNLYLYISMVFFQEKTYSLNKLVYSINLLL